MQEKNIIGCTKSFSRVHHCCCPCAVAIPVENTCSTSNFIDTVVVHSMCSSASTKSDGYPRCAHYSQVRLIPQHHTSSSQRLSARSMYFASIQHRVVATIAKPAHVSDWEIGHERETQIGDRIDNDSAAGVAGICDRDVVSCRCFRKFSRPGGGGSKGRRVSGALLGYAVSKSILGVEVSRLLYDTELRAGGCLCGELLQ